MSESRPSGSLAPSSFNLPGDTAGPQTSFDFRHRESLHYSPFAISAPPDLIHFNSSASLVPCGFHWGLYISGFAAACYIRTLRALNGRKGAAGDGGAALDPLP
jgi:hypothetical protein